VKNTLRMAGAVLAASSVVACQSAPGGLTTPDPSSSLNSAIATSSLIGATWRLVEIGGQKALPDVSVTATFTAPNSLSGSGGCNRYFGTATVTDGKIAMSPLGSTQMYCEAKGASEQEIAYFQVLAKVTGFTVIGAELRLKTAASDAALVFVRD
jgi:heat shock protein HslJ